MVGTRKNALFFGLAIACVGIALYVSPLGFRVEEDFGLYALFRMRGAQACHGDVMVVTMDTGSVDRLGVSPDSHRWPRRMHARLTEILSELGASVIVFDVFFDDPGPEGEDDLLAGALEQAGNVVLCEYLACRTFGFDGDAPKTAPSLNIERMVPPIPVLKEAAAATAPFPLPKAPIGLWKYWKFKEGSGHAPTLPVMALQVHALDVYEDFVAMIRRTAPSSLPAGFPLTRAELGSVPMRSVVRDLKKAFERHPGLGKVLRSRVRSGDGPFADGGRLRKLEALVEVYSNGDVGYLNYYGPPGTIPTVPYHDVLKAGVEGAKRGAITDPAGKTVFVGRSELTRSENKDGFRTVFTREDGADVAGVEVAATIFANHLESKTLKIVPPFGCVALIFLFGFLAGFSAFVFPSRRAAPVLVAFAALYSAGVYYGFVFHTLWVPYVIPVAVLSPLALAGNVLSRYRRSSRERSNIAEAFGYYVPAHIVESAKTDAAVLQRIRNRVHGVILCSDAARYTSLAESLDPEELNGLLNDYYKVLFEPVQRFGGRVSDVLGDSMLAVWESERENVSAGELACLAALELTDRVHRFNTKCPRCQLPTRLGLHGGEFVLSNVGAGDHYEYRPVGDVVNTASRIEGLNKYLCTDVLVSREVLNGTETFLTREIGLFVLTGKRRPLQLYELLGLKEKCSARETEACFAFATALNTYRERQWDRAIRDFERVLDIMPGDGPSRYYIDLCTSFQTNPPQGQWDGSITLAAK
jgi:adenylate cyclase